MATLEQISVLFVCLGNICRSPTAHGILDQLVKEAGLQERIVVDSAGTGDWHIGRAPDHRACQSALSRGIDISHLRARQVSIHDFAAFQYILAMDSANLAILETMKPRSYAGHLGLFLPFSTDIERTSDEVPDPYYGGIDDFDRVYQLIHGSSQGLLHHLRSQLRSDL